MKSSINVNGSYDRINKVFYYLSFSFILLYLTRYIILIQSFNTDLGGMEQINVYLISQIIEIGKYYTPSDNFPYVTAIYSPLYFWTCALVYKLFSLFFDMDTREIYLIGRYINLLFNVLSCCIVYNIGKQLRLNRLFCLALVVFFLIKLPIHALAVRPDAMKDFFILSSVFIFLIYLKKKSNFSLLLIVFFGVLGVITKQDAAIYFFLFLVTIFLLGYKMEACIVILYSIISLVFFFVAGMIMTDGSLVDNSIVSNIEFSFDFFNRFVIQLKYLIISSVVQLLVIIYAIFRTSHHNLKLFLKITAACLILSLISVLKFGAANNYFNQYFFMLTLTFIVAMFVLYNTLNKKEYLFIVISGIIAFLININLPTKYNIKEESRFKENFYYKKSLAKYITEKYENEKFLILDIDLIPFLEYGKAFKGFNIIFFQFLYSNYGFYGNKHYVVGFQKELKSKFINDIDCILLEDNVRNEDIYINNYKDSFVLKSRIDKYNLYKRKSD